MKCSREVSLVACRVGLGHSLGLVVIVVVVVVVRIGMIGLHALFLVTLSIW